MDPWGSIASLSKDEIVKLQSRKLNYFINNYLYPFSPHYQKLFTQQNLKPQSIKTVKDLQHIPFSSKLDFVDDKTNPAKFKEFIMQPDEEKIRKYWPKSKLLCMLKDKLLKGEAHVKHELSKEFKPVFMTFTTGTTNKPVSFMYSNYDISNLHIYGSRMLHMFGFTGAAPVINLFPYAPHLAFWQVVFGGLASCTLMLSTGGGKVMGTAGNIAAIERMRPQALLGVPSYVYHVLRVAKEDGMRLDSIKKIVLGAARVTVSFKQKIVEILESMGARDVKIFGTYGFTEARCAWAECPASNDSSSGYHLYPDKEIIEIIDPETGDVKEDGQDGEIVYTSIDSRASSVIRYRTGDFVKGGITYEPCPHCKRQVPRLSSDITRLSDIKDLQLSKIKGALVNLSNFDALFAGVELVEEWQVELKKRNDDPFDVDELIVYVCANGDCDTDQLKEEIKKQISIATEVTPNRIEFIKMDEMVKRLELETANKEKRIIDNRPKA